MKIKIETHVKKSITEVKKGFDLSLFEALAPFFPKIKVLRFDGCKTGDEVWIEMDFWMLKQRWDATIIEENESKNEWYFIDKGAKMPFKLTFWQHKHQVLKIKDNHSIIVDAIEFRTSSILLDLFLYPFFFMQFFARRPIYKKVFA